jgi:hypothetical protein
MAAFDLMASPIERLNACISGFRPAPKPPTPPSIYEQRLACFSLMAENQRKMKWTEQDYLAANTETDRYDAMRRFADLRNEYKQTYARCAEVIQDK